MSKKTLATVALSLLTPFAFFLALPVVVQALFAAVALSPIVISYVILAGRQAEARAAVRVQA